MSDYVDYDDPYDTGGVYEVEQLRVRLGNLLLMTAVVLVGLLILVILWKVCFSDDSESQAPSKLAPGSPQAVYAHEIEPGFVVLQSQDGQFFRILQEYSQAEWKRTSSRRTGNGGDGRESRASLTRSDSSSTWRPLTQSDMTVYTPHYTSAHYQTQPTAPMPHHVPVGMTSPSLPQQSAMMDEELLYLDEVEPCPRPPPYNEFRN